MEAGEGRLEEDGSLSLPLGDEVPRSGGPLSQAAGRLALRLLGWRLGGAIPDVPKCVLAVAPHTSNWDFVVGMATRLALGLGVSWLGKHNLFRPPFGDLLRWLGGIPVDRGAAAGTVAQVVETIRERERVFVAVAPEGTRRKVARWKTGFHRIALEAGLPIVPVALDYRRRRVVFLPPVPPSPDVEADLAALRALFAPEMARWPERF